MKGFLSYETVSIINNLYSYGYFSFCLFPAIG